MTLDVGDRLELRSGNVDQQLYYISLRANGTKDNSLKDTTSQIESLFLGENVI